MEFLSLRLSIRISVAAQLNLTRLHQPKIWSRQFPQVPPQRSPLTSELIGPIKSMRLLYVRPLNQAKSNINSLSKSPRRWIGQLEQRFGAQGKILIYLEQSRGALIYHFDGL